MAGNLDLIGKKILGYTVEERIGSGGFGTVYKVSKSNESGKYVSALKHIVIPTEAQYYDVLNSLGGDHDMAEDHFKLVLQNIIDEIKLLQSLSEKNNSHIVTYYDNEVVKSENPLRYDIFIRMEYLKPFSEYIMENRLTVGEVIYLGIDILSAVELCHSNGVIHRDIKDDNIFVTKDGRFKLGDFGVAKDLKDKSRALSMKGTPAYVAPEILAMKEYDHTVDFYSLGILLYKLLNYARLPFLSNYPEKYTIEDIERSIERRQKGEVPRRPLNAPAILGDAIKKACSPREKRYYTALEFKNALLQAKQSLAEEELEKVVMHPTKKQSETNVTTVLGGENDYLQRDKSEFGETVMADRSEDSINDSEFEQTLGSNRYIFETGGLNSLKQKSNRFETYYTNDSGSDNLNVAFFDGRADESEPSPAAINMRPPKYEKENIQANVSEKTSYKKVNYIDIPKARKKDFSIMIYLSPVLILIFAIIYYTNTFSFLGNVPYIGSIFGKLSFTFIISIAFIISLFFVGKQLQERRESPSNKAILIGNETYHILLEITSLFKEIMVQQKDATPFIPILKKMKQLEDQLKIEQSFGNEKVVEIENEIASMLNDMKNQIISLQKQNSGQLESIEDLMTKINERLRKRKEILRR